MEWVAYIIVSILGGITGAFLYDWFNVRGNK